MVAKFAIFSCLVAAAAAIAVPVVSVPKVAYAEPELPAQYDFEYVVHDNQSGDVKQQKESRSGDAVHGSYSLVQPDGVHRIVEYTSDGEHGFNAVVRYEGTPIAAPTKVAYAAAPVAKVAYAAPVAKVAYAPAPITYAAAPVAKVAYAPAPINYAPAPISYAPAPITYGQAPIAKVAYATAPVAKVAYDAPLGHVTFSSPSVTYQH